MTRLLFIIPEYPPDFGGGIATFYGTLLPALVRRGLSVTAIVGSALAEGPSPREDQGVRILPLDRVRARALASRFTSLALAPDVCHHLACAWAAWEQTSGGSGYDHVECADWGLSFVPWLLRSDAPPTRVRLHASIGQIARHEPQPGFALSETLAGLIEARLLPRAAERVTYGSANRDFWRTALAADVSLRPPAFTPPATLASPSPVSERALVAGRIQNWKGPATLCRALRLLGGEAPAFDWLGRSTRAPDGRDTSAALAADFPDVWGPVITPAAPVPPTALFARQSTARLVVVPSDWDVFNFTAVEAMCAGAPVICSEGAGAADLIRSGENGFRFPAGDAEALAACLREVLAFSADQRARLGAAARATIVKELDPDRIAAIEHDALAVRPASLPALPVDRDLDAVFAPDHKASPHGLDGLSRLPLSVLTRHTKSRILDRLFRRP
jgi:glycosyltransferase involved in cell wall biosynthesis